MMAPFRQDEANFDAWSLNQDLIQTENAIFVDLESESKPHSDRNPQNQMLGV
jgi:hypothetical protein